MPLLDSSKNLLNEGIPKTKIHVTGNTVIDALLKTTNLIKNTNKLKNSLEKEFDFLDKNKKLILVTGHRRENFGDGLKNICDAIKELSKYEIQIVYSVHLNPNVKKTVFSILGKTKNVFLLEPLDYIQFVYLMERSYFILSDSGGIQEEAPSLKKPVLVMRNVTERPEALKSGSIKLVGSNKLKIVKESLILLNNKKKYNLMRKNKNPYGEGKSSNKILRVIKKIKQTHDF